MKLAGPMIAASFILFLLPASLLWAAWRHVFRTGQESTHVNWRTYILKTSLVVAGFSTVMSLVFLFSWFHNGGSPHGMYPSPGLWRYFGPVSGWSGVVSIVTGVLGKGKGRLLVTGSAIAVIFAKILVLALEMD